jgi:hypothetical protein
MSTGLPRGTPFVSGGIQNSSCGSILIRVANQYKQTIYSAEPDFVKKNTNSGSGPLTVHESTAKLPTFADAKTAGLGDCTRLAAIGLSVVRPGFRRIRFASQGLRRDLSNDSAPIA